MWILIMFRYVGDKKSKNEQEIAKKSNSGGGEGGHLKVERTKRVSLATNHKMDK